MCKIRSKPFNITSQIVIGGIILINLLFLLAEPCLERIKEIRDKDRIILFKGKAGYKFCYFLNVILKLR